MNVYVLNSIVYLLLYECLCAEFNSISIVM